MQAPSKLAHCDNRHRPDGWLAPLFSTIPERNLLSLRIEGDHLNGPGVTTVIDIFAASRKTAADFSRYKYIIYYKFMDSNVKAAFSLAFTCPKCWKVIELALGR